ncbi:MAG: hypothetical protein JXB25_05795 [Deltaproteobacteria bacterium]|nr:hypothetical protein [Deltaproteobacteria bacterium]
MTDSEQLKNALDKSLRLYGEMLRLSELLDAGLSSWDGERMMAHAEEVRNLQAEVETTDAEIERITRERDLREACREYHRKRAEIMKMLLLHNRDKIPVIERMMAMVRAEMSQTRAFRHAADGYFGARDAKGGLLIKTA